MRATAAIRMPMLLTALAGVLLPAAVAAQPQLARDRAVRDLIERSASSRTDLSDVASGVSPLQIPLLADALAEAEVRGVPGTEQEYVAMVRWHHWLGRQLDPTNRGFWSRPAEWAEDPVPAGDRVLPGLAALELLQLRALARLAEHRGYVFDALVWWREHASLLERLGDDLYDPVATRYAALDRAGQREAGEPRLEALLPWAWGAPIVEEQAKALARGILAGAPEPDFDDPAVRLHATQVLDPLSGWPQRPELDLVDARSTAELFRAAVGRLHDASLRTLVDETLTALDLPPQDSVLLRLGSHVVHVPVPRAQVEPLARTWSSIEFLERTRLIPVAEGDSIQALVTQARAAAAQPDGAVPDSVVSTLARALGAWRQRDIDTTRPRRLAGEPELAPPNGTGDAAAFRLSSTDTRHWVDEALRRITEDILALHLRAHPQALYRAQLEPHALPRGMAPTLRVRYRSRIEFEKGQSGAWSGAWTTGHTVDQPFPIEFGAPRELEQQATIPSPPGDLGLWWLIVTGPAGAPRSAPGVALVEPFLATVSTAAVGRDGTTTFEVVVASRVSKELPGRFDLIHSVDWKLAPEINPAFALGPGERRLFRLTLSPATEAGPGVYPIEWRFYAGASSEKRIPGELVIPFHWLRIGPFTLDRDVGLEKRLGPEGPVDLLATYRDGGRRIQWEHLPSSTLRENGWITLSSPHAGSTVPATTDPEVARGGPDPASVWYLLTAFSSTSRDATLGLESAQPALVRLNGRERVRCEGYREKDSAEVRLDVGTNYLLLKLVDATGEGRVRITVNDVDGSPLRGVNNDLQQLIDGVKALEVDPDSSITVLKTERRAMRLVPFTYYDPKARRVAIVGTFNGWSPTAHPMVDLGNGNWRCEVRLRPGRFEYKLAVDSDTWIADPDNPLGVADGFGGRNSVIVVE